MKKNILALFSIFSLISFSGISGMEVNFEEHDLKEGHTYQIEGKACKYIGIDDRNFKPKHHGFRFGTNLLVLIPVYTTSKTSQFDHWKRPDEESDDKLGFFKGDDSGFPNETL